MALPDVLAGMELPTTRVRIMLRPDLAMELRRIDGEKAKSDSLGDKNAARRDEIEAEMRAATVVFTLRALPRRRWTRLLAEHPAEEGNREQKALGYNAETFHDALVRESIVDPELDDEAWERLEDLLTEGHWQRLWSEAQALNITSFDLPFE